MPELGLYTHQSPPEKCPGFEYAKHAADYGINVGNAGHDFGGIVKRSRGVADKMSKGVQFLMKK